MKPPKGIKIHAGHARGRRDFINMQLGTIRGLLLAVWMMMGCSHEAGLPVSAGTGPNPVLPAPAIHLIPTVNIAPAKRWTDGGKPIAAEGAAVALFADELDHPR
jgi:hypothetical protein